MTHHQEAASREVEASAHRHRPEEEAATPFKRLWLKWPPAAERDWLKRSWEEAEHLLDCKQCVPGLDSSQRQKIRVRWLNEAEHYDKLWRQRRSWDYVLRVLIIIGAATIPVLAGLTGHIPTAIAGGVVAALAGLDGLFQLGNRWRQLRQTATLMTREGWSFLELTGPYRRASHSSAYLGFLDRLEELNAVQTEGYLRVLEERRSEK